MSLAGGAHHHHGLPTAEETEGRIYDHRVAARLWGYLSPMRGRIAIGLALMGVASVTNLVGPYLVKEAIDSAIAQRSLRALDVIAVLYLINALVGLLAQFGQNHTMAAVGQRFIYRLRTQLFAHLHRLSLRFYERAEVGRLISVVQNDVAALTEVITWGITGIAADLLTLAGIVVVMLSMDRTLALLTFAVFPLLIWVAAAWRGRARDLFHQVRRTLGIVNANLQENITGVRVVQAFAREERNQGNFDRLNRAHWQANVAAETRSALLMPTVDLIGALAIGLILWVGGGMALREELTAGVLVAFILYVTRFFEPIRDLSERYTSLQAAMVAGERTFELLDMPVDLEYPEDGVELTSIKGQIRLEKVTFGYEPGRPVLQGIDLEIAPGEVVALVGATGAGKTSIANLIARFYDPWEGRATIDGSDLRGVTKGSLRRQFAIVPQEPFLFSGTVQQNIRYGRLDATDEDIEAAARVAKAHEFITHLPQGYDTEVHERGVKLSTGQRQLIALARTVLADPRIIILDEATSNVDTETEALIQQALRQLLRGRTALVIAHRLSTVRNADQIIVLSHGEIMAVGTHDELMRQDGLYRQLYARQFLTNPA